MRENKAHEREKLALHLEWLLTRERGLPAGTSASERDALLIIEGLSVRPQHCAAP